MNIGMDGFRWESEAQEQGFGNLVQYLRQYGRGFLDTDLKLVAAYFIQKDHDSNQFHTDLVGSQISSLQDEIKLLQDEIAHLKESLDGASEIYKSQAQTIEAIMLLLNKNK